MYYGIEPWGEERADLRAGIIASVIANKPGLSKGGRTKPTDFMVNFSKPVRKQQTLMEQFLTLRALTTKSTKANG